MTSLRSLMLCDAGWRGPVPGRTSGWKKIRPARQWLAVAQSRIMFTMLSDNFTPHVHDATTNVHNYTERPVTPTGYTYSGHAPSLHSSYARRPSLASSRASIPAMPSPPAPRHVASSGLAVLRRACEGASLRLRVVRAAASMVAGIRSGSPAGERTCFVRLL
jgi:hypothetical protein